MAKWKAGSKKGKKNPETAMVAYRGPIITKSPTQQTFRTTCLNRFTVTGTSASYIESYYSTASALTAVEFSNFAPLYKEYRVLGLSFEYYPWYDSGGYTGSTNQLSVGWAAPYHGPPPAFQGAVTSGTDLQVLQMEGSKPFHPGKPLRVEWRMNDVEEAQFISTSSSYSVGGIYAMVPTVTANKQYGTLVCRCLIEFKGRI
jgi:hypothetical protein